MQAAKYDRTPRHQMLLAIRHGTGAETWMCPVCGRRMVVTWEPFKRTVTEAGNEHVLHTAERNGLDIAEVTTLYD